MESEFKEKRRNRSFRPINLPEDDTTDSEEMPKTPPSSPESSAFERVRPKPIRTHYWETYDIDHFSPRKISKISEELQYREDRKEMRELSLLLYKQKRELNRHKLELEKNQRSFNSLLDRKKRRKSEGMEVKYDDLEEQIKDIQANKARYKLLEQRTERYQYN